MSASLKWRPASDHGRPLNHGGSSVVAALERAFGAQPWIVGAAQIERLQGLADGYGGMDGLNPYLAIIEKIRDEDGNCNDIELWPEY